MDPAPAATKRLKFPGENGSRKEIALEDFALKAQVVAFFEFLRELGNGMVDRIEVANGLPVGGVLTVNVRPEGRMTIE